MVAVGRDDGHPPPSGLRRGGSTRLAVGLTAVRNTRPAEVPMEQR